MSVGEMVRFIGCFLSRSQGMKQHESGRGISFRSRVATVSHRGGNHAEAGGEELSQVPPEKFVSIRQPSAQEHLPRISSRPRSCLFSVIFLCPIILAYVVIFFHAPALSAEETGQDMDETEALIQLHNPEDAAMRARAAERLGASGNPRYADPLKWAIKDKALEVRLAAATALGQLPEEAAVPALSEAFYMTRDTATRKTLLDSFHAFPPAADVVYASVIEDRYAGLTMREHALELYLSRPPPDAREFLKRVARSELGDFQARLEKAIRSLPEQTSPTTAVDETGILPSEPAPDIPAAPSETIQAQSLTAPAIVEPEKQEVTPEELVEAPRMRGRWLVISSSAFYSATFMELMRRGARSEVSPGWTYPIGLTVGGGTAYLLTHFSKGVPTGKAYWWASSTLWGIGASHWAANAVGETEESHRRLYNLTGEAIGLTVGGISAFKLDWSVGDTMYVNSGGIFGGFFGWGLENLGDTKGAAAKAGFLSLAGAAGGLTAAALTTEKVFVRRANVSRVFLGTAYGAWAGGWAPRMFESDPHGNRSLGGSMAGMSAGYLAGLIVNQKMGDAPTHTLRTTGWTLMGTQFGAGAGFLLFDQFEQPSTVFMEAAGLGGMLIGANYARIFPETRKQPGFKSWIFLSGAYYGALLPSAFRFEEEAAEAEPPSGPQPPTPQPPPGPVSAEKQEDKGEMFSSQRPLGGIMIGIPILTAATIAIGNAVEVPPRATEGLFLGEMLGGTMGAGMGLLMGGGSPILARFMIPGGALGSYTGYRMSQRYRWELTPREKSFVFLTTLSGAWWGGWASSLLEDKNISDSRVVGGVLSAAPLALAFSFTTINHTELRPRLNHGLFFGEALGFTFGTGVGMVRLGDRRARTGFMLSGGAVGMLAGGLFSRSMEPPSPMRGWREKLLMTYSSAAGAWYGGWIAHSFRLPGRDVSSDRVLGGALIGATSALPVSIGVVNRYDVPPRTLSGLFWGQVFGGVAGQGIGWLATSKTPNEPTEEFLETEEKELDRATYMMAGGSFLGMTGGLLFARNMAPKPPFDSRRDFGYFALNSVSAAWYGAWLPTLAEDRIDLVEERHIWGGVSSALPVSMATSIWITNHVGLAPRTLPSMFLGEVFGTSFGLGLAMTSRADGWTTRTLMVSGTAVGEALGYAYGRSLRSPLLMSHAQGRGTVWFGTLSGAWYGALVPTLFEDWLAETSQRRMAGGMMMAAPVGLASSLFIANRMEIKPRVPSGLFMGQILGSVTGSGLAFLTTSDPRSTRVMMLSGSAVGAISGLGFVNRMAAPSPVRGRAEQASIFLGTAAGSWYGFWLPTLAEADLDDISDRQILGGPMVAGPVSLASSIWIANHYDISPTVLGGLYGGQLWGWSVGTGIGLVSLSSRRTTTSLMMGTGVLGGVGGLLASRRSPSGGAGRASDAYGPLVSASTLTGLWYGGWAPTLAAAKTDDISGRRVLGGLMIGAPMGVATGMFLRGRNIQPRAYSGFFFGETLGGMAGAGTAFIARASYRASTVSMLATGAAVGISGARLLPRIPEPPAASDALAMGGLFGSAYGAALPLVIEGDRSGVDEQQVTGGVLLGGPLGIMLTTLSFSVWQPPPDSVGFISLAGLVGSLSGLGLGFTIEDWSDRNIVLSMYSTGLSGLLVGGRAAPNVEYSRGARLFSVFGTLFGASQGYALGIFGDSSDRQTAGATLLGASLGLGTSLLVTYDLQVGTGTAAVAYTGGLWGGFVGSMFAQAASGSKREATTAAVITSNVGQIVTSYSLLQLKVPPRRMGWINVFGLTGLGVGSAVGLPLSRGGDVFFISAPVGSLLGLVGGVFATSYWDWDKPSNGSVEDVTTEWADPDRRPMSLGGRGWKSNWPVIDALAPQFAAGPDPMGGEEDVRYTFGVILWYH